MSDVFLLWVGGAATVWAAGIALYFLITPGRTVPKARRRYRPDDASGILTRAADQATAAAGQLLGDREGRLAESLVRAGVKQRPRDVVVLAASAALVLFAVGLLTRGLLLAVVLAALAPLGTWLLLLVRTQRRQRAFANQLEETLQMLAGSLRAGYSLPQAAATVATEAEAPTSEEFARVINEARVGRSLIEAFHDAAVRVRSDDFYWIVQAITINREVGGNLAEVLEGVGKTIRERVHLRRQVEALASEGKLSAIILIALPPAVILLLSVSQPEYLARFGESALGIALLVVAAVLLIVGALWLRALVRIKF